MVLPLNPVQPIYPPPYYRTPPKPEKHALVGLGGMCIAFIIDSALESLHCSYEVRGLGIFVPVVVGGSNALVALALSVLSRPNYANIALQPNQNWVPFGATLSPAR